MNQLQKDLKQLNDCLIYLEQSTDDDPRELAHLPFQYGKRLAVSRQLLNFFNARGVKTRPAKYGSRNTECLMFRPTLEDIEQAIWLLNSYLTKD